MTEVLELPLPAVDAKQYEKLSPKYQMVRTTDVVDIMRENGFKITQAHSMKPRTRDPRIVEHFMRMRHESHMDAVNGTVPEILVLNSHDGTTALRMEAALFRLVCGNGLIVKSNDIYSCRMRHTDVTEQRVVEEAEKVIQSAREAARRIELFNGKILNSSLEYSFATEASELALKIVGANMRPGDLLASRREEDEGHQLWHVFNRVQENLVKGGVQYKTQKGRQMTSRGITGATPLVQMNERLWALAESYL